MTFTNSQRLAFETAVKSLSSIRKGEEAILYTALRTLLTKVLFYSAKNIVVETANPRRAGMSVLAPGATKGCSVVWIVGHCSAERGTIGDAPARRLLYADHAQFITADTAWFLMADPDMLVIRSIGAIEDHAITWQGLTIEGFAAGLALLSAKVAGTAARLAAFRAGDESLIARDRLSARPDADAETALAIQINQNLFFDTLHAASATLHEETLNALRATRLSRDEIMAQLEPFAQKYHGFLFCSEPIAIEGKRPVSTESERSQRTETELLSQSLTRPPALARLSLDALPGFAADSGLDLKADADKSERLFASQTANLILARILLIRFFEDHGFFDFQGHQGQTCRRYLCNGGMDAFEALPHHFASPDAGLPADAAPRAGRFCSPAFDGRERDWVMALATPKLRQTIEWAMFRLARFDFTTARGDLMSAVYERFLDRRQRKEQGEVYTPPSIARYLIDRLALSPDAAVLDPACGSGTFLIERYRQACGEAADCGAGNYAEARRVMEKLAGNDLNPFSAALAEIQLFWHLFSFSDDIRRSGFPELKVTGRANSLVPGHLCDPSRTRFALIDHCGYDAVIGNPPYVRVERAHALPLAAQDDFTGPRNIGGRTFNGIATGANASTLFIYRALDHWCRQDGNGAPAGRLAFVVPLSFCVSSEASQLRQLFQPGQRWAIREIVDLELIWREIFDADVLAMLLVAEARPAQKSDTVRIRLADETCVNYHPGARRPSFRFDHLPEQVIGYDRLFAPDGRIVTRLTDRRATILRKLWNNPTLRDAAMPYWTRRGETPTRRPPGAADSALWQENRLIKEGLAKRGQVHLRKDGGHSLFKGENITACRITGEPVFENFDVTRASSPSIWAYAEILPKTMYALPIIEQLPVAAPFCPADIAMENTVTLFGPRADLSAVPFDVILMSSIYGFFHVIANRRSYQNRIRGHIYPTAVASLPWNDALKAETAALRAIGRRLMRSCERRFTRCSRLAEEIATLGLKPLEDVVRATRNAELTRSDSFACEPAIRITLGDVKLIGGAFVLSLNAGKTHSISFNNQGVAKRAAAGLALLEGTEATWPMLLQAPVPVSSSQAAALARLRYSLSPQELDAAIAVEIEKLDVIVGEALGLSSSDVTFIRKEMAQDPFLARVRPRYPFFVPRQQGRRKNLERKDRYSL